MKGSRTKITWISISLAALSLIASCQNCGRKPPTGGGVSGSIYYQAAENRSGTKVDKIIFMPDIDVFLHNVGDNSDTNPVKTDFYGRYRFPHQKPGTYQLRWKAQLGWAAGQHPDNIVIESGDMFPIPARVGPDKDQGVIFGRVTLNDGSTPWAYDELFRLNHTASVTVMDPNRTTKLSGPIHTNSEGRYAAAGIPRSQRTAIEAQSEAATVDQALDGSRVSVGNPVIPTDLTLPNKAPEIIAFMPQSGGSFIKTAAAGSTITVVAQARDLDGDNLKYEWNTVTGHGTLTPGSGNSAQWQLPNNPGRFSAYVQASDSRGGFAQQRIDFITELTEATFAGVVVEKVSGARVVGAEVSANGKVTTTNANGFFSVKTPLKDRYVLNISKEGFALFSRVVDAGLTGQTWPLVKAQSEVVDPRNPIDLVDKRPELDREKLRGSRIKIPANALVSATGTAPAGTLNGYIATLNVGDGDAPGDWGAMRGTTETNLISYGATFVEFRDAAGVKYNLAPGMEAQVESFLPPGTATAPADVKLWSYDEADGFWKESGKSQFISASGSFSGTVTHFSTINTDVEKDDDACLKILIYPPIPTGVKLRVTSSAFSQAFEGVLDAGINAVFRLPSNTDVQLQLKNANGSAYPNPVLLEEQPGFPLPGNVVNTGAPLASGQSSFPPEPYEPCKLVILREPNEPSANQFLIYKDAGSAAKTAGYYQAVDPNGERTTLGAWWAKNGFTLDGNGNVNNGVRTSYVNFNDLGSGRDMYFLQRADGTAAAFVTNYGLFDQNHGNADLAVDRQVPGATVCMEYSPVEGQGTTRIVKFFVFAGADFKSAAPRVDAADLDGFGAKFVPNLCNNCHGGSYFPNNVGSPTFAEVNMGSSFRELDIATYKFPEGRDTANSTEKAAFKQQNLIVKGAAAADTIAIQPIKDLINGWYPGASDDQDNTFTPSGWTGTPQSLYHDVVKQSCRTCHVALDAQTGASGLGWISYAQLEGRRSFLPYIVLCDARQMPHAVITYRNFWLSAGPHRPASLRTFSNGSGWQQIGACQ
jgi:hypothetical protein